MQSIFQNCLVKHSHWSCGLDSSTGPLVPGSTFFKKQMLLGFDLLGFPLNGIVNRRDSAASSLIHKRQKNPSVTPTDRLHCQPVSDCLLLVIKYCRLHRCCWCMFPLYIAIHWDFFFNELVPSDHFVVHLYIYISMWVTCWDKLLMGE